MSSERIARVAVAACRAALAADDAAADRYVLEPEGRTATESEVVEVLALASKPVEVLATRRGSPIVIRHEAVVEPVMQRFLVRQTRETKAYLSRNLGAGRQSNELVVLVRTLDALTLLSLDEYATWLGDYSMREMTRAVRRPQGDSDAVRLGADMVVEVSGPTSVTRIPISFG